MIIWRILQVEAGIQTWTVVKLTWQEAITRRPNTMVADAYSEAILALLVNYTQLKREDTTL